MFTYPAGTPGISDCEVSGNLDPIIICGRSILKLLFRPFLIGNPSEALFFKSLCSLNNCFLEIFTEIVFKVTSFFDKKHRQL